MRSTWRTLPKNVELMPQHQDLGLQLLSRLEAVAQHATNNSPIAIMRRSCSDSPPTASQLDRVFGSDSRRFYSLPTPARRNTVSLGPPPRQHAASLEFTTIAGNRSIPNRRARRTTASSFMLRMCTSSEEEASRF